MANSPLSRRKNIKSQLRNLSPTKYWICWCGNLCFKQNSQVAGVGMAYGYICDAHKHIPPSRQEFTPNRLQIAPPTSTWYLNFCLRFNRQKFLGKKPLVIIHSRRRHQPMATDDLDDDQPVVQLWRGSFIKLIDTWSFLVSCTGRTPNNPYTSHIVRTSFVSGGGPEPIDSTLLLRLYSQVTPYMKKNSELLIPRIHLISFSTDVVHSLLVNSSIFDRAAQAAHLTIHTHHISYLYYLSREID